MIGAPGIPHRNSHALSLRREGYIAQNKKIEVLVETPNLDKREKMPTHLASADEKDRCTVFFVKAPDVLSSPQPITELHLTKANSSLLLNT